MHLCFVLHYQHLMFQMIELKSKLCNKKFHKIIRKCHFFSWDEHSLWQWISLDQIFNLVLNFIQSPDKKVLFFVNTLTLFPDFFISPTYLSVIVLFKWRKSPPIIYHLKCMFIVLPYARFVHDFCAFRFTEFHERGPLMYKTNGS